MNTDKDDGNSSMVAVLRHYNLTGVWVRNLAKEESGETIETIE